MKIELHLLQNFAPSNLNRDDTGAPKDCEFGGVRRARISSQCFKRAIREAFETEKLFGAATEDRLAARTKRLVDHATAKLVELGHDAGEAAHLVEFALQGAKLKVKEERKTQYLLFLPRRAITDLATLIHTHWEELKAAAPAPAGADAEASDEKPGKKKTKAQEKNEAKSAVPKPVTVGLEKIFKDTQKTPDLALFGRMIADAADWNVDAACQVAQAISTHRATMEFDFYTAVDDLKPNDTAGSDMMGTVAYQSACFYRYSCLDVDALTRNLGGADAAEAKALTKETIDAFLRATALAIPTGKQNSMAAQNRPSYLLAVVREKGTPLSLANAFVKPVKASGDQDLVTASAAKLEAQLKTGLELWGSAGVHAFRVGEVAIDGASAVPGGFDGWVSAIVAAWESRA